MSIAEFPWRDRWLNGSEYDFMLQHYLEYSTTYAFSVLTEHPACIYTNPTHGLVYFLRDQSLRDLGFPRVRGLHKRFKWKKMNFITPLPKQKPVVHYLVATGRLGSVCYRMHIVAGNYPSGLVICQMLKIQSCFKLGVGIPSRQHFKDSLAMLSPSENSNTETMSPAVSFEVCQSSPEMLIEKRLPFPQVRHSRARHPVEVIAYHYLLGPFQLESPKNEDSDNCMQELLVKVEPGDEQWGDLPS